MVDFFHEFVCVITSGTMKVPLGRKPSAWLQHHVFVFFIQTVWFFNNMGLPCSSGRGSMALAMTYVVLVASGDFLDNNP